MYKGIYIALSGAVLKQKHMDVHAQNMANANTSGYKRERLSFKDYMIPVDNRRAGEVDGRKMTELSDVTVDFSPGIIMETDNPLDVAIHDEGFFAIEGNKYTRNGQFAINSEGLLTTQSGETVLGDGGPITVQGNRVEIDTSGEVIVDDISVGKIKIVTFSDKGVLRKIDGGMYYTNTEGEEVNAQVSQGFLEGSNVSAIREMIEMMKSHREFESYQKMIHALDEAASKTINEMGR